MVLKQLPEVHYKKSFLKNAQNLQENAFTGVSFWTKLQDGALQLCSKQNPAQVFFL